MMFENRIALSVVGNFIQTLRGINMPTMTEKNQTRNPKVRNFVSKQMVKPIEQSNNCQGFQ